SKQKLKSAIFCFFSHSFSKKYPEKYHRVKSLVYSILGAWRRRRMILCRRIRDSCVYGSKKSSKLLFYRHQTLNKA
ncbi:hypothetical protein, partial [Prevotella pectinovora]|uniref:hypothetical protein n=1 Tax=Prevotella pectinovora TaxID=1602169 RepID=UPI002FD96796